MTMCPQCLFQVENGSDDLAEICTHQCDVILESHVMEDLSHFSDESVLSLATLLEAQHVQVEGRVTQRLLTCFACAPTPQPINELRRWRQA